MPEYEHQRESIGRRQQDADCAAHESRIDHMDMELHKQSGWLKAGAGFLSIAILIIGSFNGVILTKLSNIETMLSDGKVVQMQHSEQIKNLDQRVKDIEDRHRKDIEDGIINRSGISK